MSELVRVTNDLTRILCVGWIFLCGSVAHGFGQSTSLRMRQVRANGGMRMPWLIEKREAGGPNLEPSCHMRQQTCTPLNKFVNSLSVRAPDFRPEAG